MAFPTVYSRQNQAQGTAGTAHVSPAFAACSAGDLLVVVLGYGSGYSAVSAAPSGWLYVVNDQLANHALVVAVKIATGSEGGTTQQFDTTGSCKAAILIYQISGWRNGTLASDIGVGAQFTGSNTTPDPGSGTATWGAEDNLWLAVAALNASTTVGAAPTNYSNGQGLASGGSGGATSKVTTGGAERNLNAATEDPGAWSAWGTSATWVARVVIIRPAAGATGATKDVPSRFRAIAQTARDVGTRFQAAVRATRDVQTRSSVIARTFRNVGSRFGLAGAVRATRDVQTRSSVIARTFRNVGSRFGLAGGTRMWLRDVTSPNAPTAGTKSALLPVGSATSNSGATNLSLALSGHRGSSQTSRSVSSDANANHQDQLIARFTSDPLATGSVAAQQWTLAIAAAEADAHANSYLVASLYVWRPSTSAVVGYVYDSDTPLGAEWDPAERGFVATLSGSAVSGSPKDVLVLEVWRHTPGAV